MIIGCEYNQKFQSLLISYINSEGKTGFLQKKLHKSELFNWTISKNPTVDKNWDGRYIKRTPSDGKWLSKERIYELILEKLTKEEIDHIYESDFTPNKSYLDIEIELTSDDFPDPAKAEMPVNLITFCNSNNDCFVLSTMKDPDTGKHLNKDEEAQINLEIHEYFAKVKNIKETDRAILDQKFNINYIHFNTETEMLECFFHKILPKLPVITGWNVINFDWVYLMNRCKRIKVDPFLTLPSQRVVSKHNKIPLHTAVLDYMDMVMQMKPFKVIENYKLDYFANLSLNVTKLKSQHKSMREAQKYVAEFTKYNIIDVLIVKMLDDKHELLDVALSLSKVARVEINKVFNPVHITETLICREFLSKGLKMAKDGQPENANKSGTYTGAFVMPPIPGHYDYVACYDFASMYPNVQMQFNISPDSFLGNSNSRLRDTDILTKNETLFSGEKDSVTRVILNRLYNKRVETKAKMKQL
jgi:DNA polymerase elongation subunit (family B)